MGGAAETITPLLEHETVRLGSEMKFDRGAGTSGGGLLSVPLVRQMFSDPSVRVAFRAIDRSWMYQKIFGLSVTGFNPFGSELYVARLSALADWLRDGRRRDRRHNVGDALVHEVLFLVHDYLHIWARMVIQNELPELELGHGKITRRSLETFAFCHLATEAVATVGLDYWYLSTIELDEVCGIGTCIRNLVCSYREQDLTEYRRFNETYDVQHPEFLVKMAEFYATGEFDGFSAEDALASPKLLRWTEHELTYGRTQRSHIRAWLSYLSNGAVVLAPEELSAPITLGKKWQRTLLRKLAGLLWRKVKDDELLGMGTRPQPGTSWRRDREKDQRSGEMPDFCFTNINRLARLDLATLSNPDLTDLGYRIFCAQWLSAHELETVPTDVRRALGPHIATRDFSGLFKLFRKHGVRRVPKGRAREPLDLFVLP